MLHREPAILVLKDGTVFRGTSIGAAGHSAGEVVFNTSMTGYQEILTDPSYCRQIVTLTYPHIGNTGTNSEDVEANKVYAAGLVIRDLPRLASNWRSTQDLSTYLREQNVVAIADIDTRKLTRILREKGAQDGCVMAGKIDEPAALKAARDAINPRPDTPGHFLFVGTGSHRALVGELTARRNQAFTGATSVAYPVLDKAYIAYLLDRLAALIPPPRRHRYVGCLAPNASLPLWLSRWMLQYSSLTNAAISASEQRPSMMAPTAEVIASTGTGRPSSRLFTAFLSSSIIDYPVMRV